MTTRRLLAELRATPRSIGSISEGCGVSRREVEKAVELARIEGLPICSGGRGVWVTESPEELRANYRALRRRAVHQLANLRGLLRAAEVMERPLVMPWGKEAA